MTDDAATPGLSNPLREDVFHTPHSTPDKRRIAEHGLCLLTEVGSTMHGVTVKVEDGMDHPGLLGVQTRRRPGVLPALA